MCCNGVIFADVQLQKNDSPEHLKSLGLPVGLRRNKSCFNQPCAALEGCRCRVYDDRPQYCREFECVLLKKVLAGRQTVDSALKVIQKAHKRAEKVRNGLRELGDDNETLALSKRFQRVRRRIESGGATEEEADAYGRLATSMHELNLLLSQEFYPGDNG